MSSVSLAFLCPRNRCTDLIDTPDEMSTEAQWCRKSCVELSTPTAVAADLYALPQTERRSAAPVAEVNTSPSGPVPNRSRWTASASPTESGNGMTRLLDGVLVGPNLTGSGPDGEINWRSILT